MKHFLIALAVTTIIVSVVISQSSLVFAYSGNNFPCQGGLCYICLKGCVVQDGSIPRTDFALMVGAITAYWQSTHPKQYGIAVCKPSQLKIDYSNSVLDQYSGTLALERQGNALTYWKGNASFCTIDFNLSFLNGSNTNMKSANNPYGHFPMWRVCLNLVHEYGHMLNYKHSNSNNAVDSSSITRYGKSVMFSSQLSDAIDLPKTACARYFPPNYVFGSGQ